MRTFWAVAGALLVAACCSRAEDDGEEPLGMSRAVACRAVNGYEDYEPLPDAALTADEKLVVYFRPLHFRTERQGKTYQAHLVEDGRIRRRGEKAVLQRKDKLLEYKPKSDEPIGPLFLKTAVSLKGLKPGEYDLELILHDQLATGPEATATQTLKFRVVPADSTPAPKE